MPPNLGQFIKLSEAPQHYHVSVKTLRRRRDKSRDSDNENFSYFIVQTKDGEIFERPSTTLVDKLTKEGRLPEWLVNHDWLRAEFGPTTKATTPTDPDSQEGGHDQPGVTPSDHPQTVDHPPVTTVVDAMQQTIEAQKTTINELLTQLTHEREDKRAILEYAKTDKELFAKVNENLTKLIPLAATNPQHTSQQGSGRRTDPPPTPQPVKSKPNPEASHTQPKKSARRTKATPRQATSNRFWRSWLGK